METRTWKAITDAYNLEDTINILARTCNIIAVIPVIYYLGSSKSSLSEALILYDNKPHIPGTGCGPG
jgi:hypothetical protein